MKKLEYRYSAELDNSTDTKEEHLAKTVKSLFKIANEILEECAQEKIKVCFDTVPTVNRGQNNKLKLKDINKNLMAR